MSAFGLKQTSEKTYAMLLSGVKPTWIDALQRPAPNSLLGVNSHARDKQTDANTQCDKPTTRLHIHGDGLWSIAMMQFLRAGFNETKARNAGGRYGPKTSHWKYAQKQ